MRRALALLEIRGGGTMSSGGQPTMNELARYDGVFRVQDETNVTLTVKWQREPTRPTSNPAGTTGWALCGEKLLRLHVCANVPCTARYRASKYHLIPPPLHVRLIETAPVPREAQEHPPEEVERILQAASGGSIPAPTASESPPPPTTPPQPLSLQALKK